MNGADLTFPRNVANDLDQIFVTVIDRNFVCSSCKQEELSASADNIGRLVASFPPGEKNLVNNMSKSNEQSKIT